jgi:hypothetical protein
MRDGLEAQRSMLRHRWRCLDDARLCKSGFSNNKRACGTHIHDIVGAQLLREHARAKSPVPSDVDTPKKTTKAMLPIVAIRMVARIYNDALGRITP